MTKIRKTSSMLAFLAGVPLGACASDALVGVDVNTERGELAQGCSSGVAEAVTVAVLCEKEVCETDAFGGGPDKVWIDDVEVLRDGRLIASGHRGWNDQERRHFLAAFEPDGSPLWEHTDAYAPRETLATLWSDLSVDPEERSIYQALRWECDGSSECAGASTLEPELRVLGLDGETLDEPRSLAPGQRTVSLGGGVTAEAVLGQGEIRVRGLDAESEPLWEMTIEASAFFGEELRMRATVDGDLLLQAGRVWTFEQKWQQQTVVRLSAQGEVRFVLGREDLEEACPGSSPRHTQYRPARGLDDLRVADGGEGRTLLLCSQVYKHDVASLTRVRLSRLNAGGRTLWKYDTTFEGDRDQASVVAAEEDIYLLGNRASGIQYTPVQHVVTRLTHQGRWCGDYAITQRSDEGFDWVNQLHLGRDGELYAVEHDAVKRLTLVASEDREPVAD